MFTYGTGGSSYRKNDASSRLSSLQKKTPVARQQVSQQRADGAFTPPKPSNTINTSYKPETRTFNTPTTQATNWANNLKTTVQRTSSGPSFKKVDNQVEKLRKQLTPKSGPKLPGHVDLNRYTTELTTIDELSKKYGFDYSREYAERQGQTIGNARRDEVEAARARLEYETEAAKTDLEHESFGAYLEQRQEMVDRGMNAGIQAEGELQLEMQRQYALSDILAEEQLANQELDRRLGTITAEELRYIEELYSSRLQQGFENAMNLSRFNQSENQWQAEMEMRQRQQIVDERWREFEFNNMSAAEREMFLQRERQIGYEQAWREYEFNNLSAAEQARIIADAEKFGMEMAWERHKFEAGMAFEAGSANIPSGGWRTSKGEPPSSFKSHLSAALQKTGLPTSWIPAVSELIARESTWNPKARNPNSTAHGYGQFLTSTRRDYERRYGIKYDTPVNQLILTLHYIKDRYGSAQKALAFHNKNNWY